MGKYKHRQLSDYQQTESDRLVQRIRDKARNATALKIPGGDKTELEEILICKAIELQKSTQQTAIAAAESKNPVNSLMRAMFDKGELVRMQHELFQIAEMVAQEREDNKQ